MLADQTMAWRLKMYIKTFFKAQTRSSAQTCLSSDKQLKY